MRLKKTKIDFGVRRERAVPKCSCKNRDGNA
jgi:hypothetical protein